MKERNANASSTEKQAAGIAAADLVKDGMVIGLGTGSTTAFAIAEVGRRVREEGLNVLAVVTSYQAEMLAIEAGVPLTSLAEHPVLDLAIDGADQVDANLNVIKGGGAAHTREKVVAHSAKRFVVVADDSKMSEKLEHFVPVEVLPYARELVKKQMIELGGVPVIRMASRKDGPVISDNGNVIMDVEFGTIEDPAELYQRLSTCVGVVEHGLFLNTNEVYVGRKGGAVEIIK
ncbi:ribose 5-phosphate isomerase A [Methanococcoides sp. AM1]|uniref:ribose 5-phosphate isomerase A n=1 Tax=Methanococcoides sp. AM1 TaxID=1201011 RepID=UPI0010842988|nr:ribose 5-phosphate isomerase A [Methanococcoides sp. AM1]